MRLDRMLGITMELLTNKRVTAAQLAARFEVSVRTIYRDVELINQAGIPVASFAGADGGFELMDGFFLTKQHFSVEDFSVIYHLLKSMDGAAGGAFAAVRRKLGSLHPALTNGGSAETVLFDLSTTESEKAVVQPLCEAIRQTNPIAFSYTSANGTVSHRQVEPLRLYWGRGAWYLEGYCLTRHAKRLFRLSRMAELQVSGETFRPREAFDEPPQEQPQGTPLHLRFDRNAQPRVFEQFPGECVDQGTHIDVHTIFYQKEYALSVVLSYGAKVEIVSPEELKGDLLQTIADIQQRYRT
ncbi:helix-turn-helix transcriptional regulator [Paenibacillus flagellatus]|uniref:YafY family transcriptional regulator n=1 Tax=Paenibacillus flagellatus TaxID=2211139 RepID=A0A2V5L3G3_9BACL|nr:YafY family protein [Paenibacillus flagellatus]PYI57366.1 YafY family transcriptional regulator [Paenibacillus flagellatus]